ncbi:hypothetical protein CERSUDRAFT_113074 [Gelatoporia subvermispora B]|uniref:Uncharacterized protein n=1 Tax=Ceriporiopsis subvermispora (strain B) TaxID=914234 RepID=M2PS32_CERS8|nr:hypothetical protein CERSUDRAFT_113074 [Gelatoporia subvermispora B]
MPRISSDDVLAHSITVLKAFKEASGAISAVPALPAVVGALLEVVETIETVRENRKLCSELKERVVELGNELKEDFEKYRDAAEPSLNEQLDRMLSLLEDIKGELDTLSRKGRLSRLAHYGSTKEALKRHLGTVDQIKHKYVRTMLTALLTTALQQASFTKDQHLLFREVELRRIHKRDVISQSDIYSEQWIAEYGNHPVAVRYLRPEQDIEDIHKKIQAYSPCRSIHIAQYLGRSHPAMTHAFVVLETGGVDTIHYFRSPGNALEKLRFYLQMLADWEDLLRYIKAGGLLPSTNKEWHIHSPACLSSLSVGKHGTFIVSAEDLKETSDACLDHRFRMADEKYDHVATTERTHRILSYDAGSRSMMHILDCGMRPALGLGIGDLHKARLPQIWSYRMAERGVHATAGDYGYEDRQRGHFVRLGNVFDIVGHERFAFWENVTYVDGIVQTVETCDVSAQQVWSLVPGHDKWIGRALRRWIDPEHLERFWWLYACDVAERHTISLEDLVVVQTLSYTRNLWTTPNIKISDAIYFHCLPAMASGEMPSPFGYWSIGAEPSPGPWPDILIPGLELNRRKDIQYAYLSATQASLVACFFHCLGDMCLPSPDSRISHH